MNRRTPATLHSFFLREGAQSSGGVRGIIASATKVTCNMAGKTIERFDCSSRYLFCLRVEDFTHLPDDD